MIRGINSSNIQQNLRKENVIIYRWPCWGRRRWAVYTGALSGVPSRGRSRRCSWSCRGLSGDPLAFGNNLGHCTGRLHRGWTETRQRIARSMHQATIQSQQYEYSIRVLFKRRFCNGCFSDPTDKTTPLLFKATHTRTRSHTHAHTYYTEKWYGQLLCFFPSYMFNHNWKTATIRLFIYTDLDTLMTNNKKLCIHLSILHDFNGEVHPILSHS